MGLRETFNRLFASTKYRLCTEREYTVIRETQRSPYEIVAGRVTSAEPVLFDVGANVGQTTNELLGFFPKGTIHSFEPTPECRAEYEKRFPGEKRVNLWPLAVADTPGTREFHMNSRSLTNSLLKVNPGSTEWIPANYVESRGSLQVEVTTLDGFCAEHKIAHLDLLKLDIQGAELSALKGAAGLLERGAVDWISLEVEFVPLYQEQPSYCEIAGYLAGLGYTLYGFFKLSRHETGRLLFADALFTKAPKA